MLTKADPAEAPIQRRIDAILILITIAILVFIASSSAKAAGGSWSIAAAEAPYPVNPFERSAFGADWAILSNDIFFGGASYLFGLSPASRTLLLTPATKSETKSESNAIVNAAGSGENLFSFTGSSSLPFTLRDGGLAPNAPSAITAIFSWSGAGGNNLWNTGANWGGTPPPTGNADTDLLFDNSTQLSNSIGGNDYKLRDLTFGTSAGAFTISGDSGKKLIFEVAGGSITSSSSSLQTFSSAIDIENKIALEIGGSGNILIGSDIIDSGSITKTGAGTLTLSGANTFSGGITINGGTLSVSADGNLGAAANQVTINNGGIFNNTASMTTLTRRFNLATAASSTITFKTDNSLSFNASGTRGITGGSSTLTIVKDGVGTFTITNNNQTTYLGTWQLNAGILATANDPALGDVNNDITLNGGTFQWTSTTTDYNPASTRTFTLNNVAANALNVNSSTRTMTFDDTNQLTGSGGFTKTGLGMVSISASQNYSGGTIVNAGTLTVTSSGNLGATTGGLTVSNPNTGAGTNVVLNLNSAQTVGLSGTIATPSGGTNTATINLTGASTILTSNQSTDTSYAGVLAGTGGLTKDGIGKLTLGGINTYTGATTISGGTLLINGSTASGSAVIVNNSGTLGGTGTVSGTVQVNSGGTLSPGTSPGTLTTGALTLSNGSTFAVDLTAGSGNDLLVAPNITLGTILTGPSLSLNITGSLAMGQQFFIVNNTGANAVSGVFAQGATITSGGYTFLINYFADFGTQSAVGGNDIMLEVAPIPEPSTWIGAALALAAIGFTQRRRLLSLLARRA